jgi:hypothetical protein
LGLATSFIPYGIFSLPKLGYFLPIFLSFVLKLLLLLSKSNKSNESPTRACSMHHARCQRFAWPFTLGIGSTTGGFTSTPGECIRSGFATVRAKPAVDSTPGGYS